jgi:DNA-binding CsgD family transcriptional regulator
MKRTVDYKKLTLREREVVDWLIQGKSSQEIALLLHISRHTVDTHRRHILKKIRVKNTLELISIHR